MAGGCETGLLTPARREVKWVQTRAEDRLVEGKCYLMSSEGEWDPSHVPLSPPDCGCGCCEHPLPLTLCALGVWNYTVLCSCQTICLGLYHVADSARNAHVSPGPS